MAETTTGMEIAPDTGVKRPREEEKGKVEEEHQAKAPKLSEDATPASAGKPEKGETAGDVNEKEEEEEEEEEGEEEKGEIEVPAISEPRAEGDVHEEVQALERGHIFFFYRPKVDLEHAKDFSEVQKTYIILYPDNKDASARMLVVPKKMLPDIKKKSDRVWTFVDIAGKIDDLVSALKDVEYETKTKGKRKQAGGRLIGRGVYLLANHKEPKSKKTFTNHVHLAYVLTHPSEPHHLQHAFHIYDEGDFIVEVKNPKEKSSHMPVTHKDLPPAPIQKIFTGHKFMPLNPPHMIDFKEVLFVAAHHYPSELEEYGEKLEETAEKEKHRVTLKKIKTELHLAKNDPNMSLDPVMGKWD